MELRLILGDQLNTRHSWFATPDTDVTFLMMEVREEATYVTHHAQKLLSFFLAMRQFADALSASGHRVIYILLSDPDNRHSIVDNLSGLLLSGVYTRVVYQEPDEYRLDKTLALWAAEQDIPVERVSAEHFLVERNTFDVVFPGKTSFLMETFYRYVRRTRNILMEGDKPVAGKWNFDADNRKKLPKQQVVPEPLLFANDGSEIWAELQKEGIPSLGHVDPAAVCWPVNREQALKLVDFFCNQLLPLFGTYQDAMPQQSWSVYHARISFALNTKMLHPGEVITAAISAWTVEPEKISYNQLEGFVRQIAGWREYMRCLYWNQMPAFAEMNYFGHKRPLPVWYWTGETKMRCVSAAIRQSLDYAYAHHIQRLMVTGNFALLAGVDPDDVDQWYLGIYIDAIEWVEITNTRGMSQYADGGLTATKPYVSSAAYIDKMSDYCTSCHYNKQQKTGDGACPFNSLYWSFLDIHRPLLGKNQRMSMMYAVWDKMNPHDQEAIRQQAEIYRDTLDIL